MHYQVGGSLTVDARSYINRKADRDLYSALKKGEFCYILNSRQMGKSSLLVRAKDRLEAEGFVCAALDLTGVGSNNVTAEQWYKGVVSQLWMGFKLLGKVNLKNWWNDRADLPVLQRLSQFVAEVLLVEFPQTRLFVFIDEIDSTMSLPFSVDDFFAFIRFCYNQRAFDRDYDRIAFAIFGVANPADLIRDKNRTPFNIGKAIALNGFTLKEAAPLAGGLQGDRRGEQTQKQLSEILHWSGGQPFLTQKLCQLCLETGARSPIFELVRSRIIEHWQSQDEPQHLRTIANRILYNQELAGRLLGLYQRILAGERIETDDSREQIELLLSGLVENRAGSLTVKNPIYAAVFNTEWVAHQLENLRPYATQFNTWIASKGEDESQLLRGLALQEALAWSANKQLSNLDYRFLSASQDLEKRGVETDLAVERGQREKAQFALEAAREAHEILGRARQWARERTKNVHLGRGWIAAIAVGAAMGTIALRWTGWLQGAEWVLLDRWFQLRPLEAVDPRIAIVSIDEADLEAIGEYPISDAVLARAIAKIAARNPRAIGLDLYRNLPVEPGYTQLAQVYQSTPSLIGIEKVVGERVGPPPILAERGRVGFADQVLDGDGTVRRALLSVRGEDGSVQLSLAVKLALAYLQTEGIEAQGRDRDRIDLGKTTLTAFKPDDGGYVRAKAGGYQILLDFRRTSDRFATFPIADLLADRLPPEALRDRVVLVGATAESINDLFQTPYSSRIAGAPQRMPGVVVHANIVSQLLSGALEGRSMLRVWPETVEWAWIGLWAAIAAGLAWRWPRPIAIPGMAIGVIGAIAAIAAAAFFLGWWIPAIPTAIAALLAASSLPILTAKQRATLELCETVEAIAQIAADREAAGRIAIEYLKQGESQETAAAIERRFAAIAPLQSGGQTCSALLESGQPDPVPRVQANGD
ncbi:CHASE2 domain-containing protein [Oxynema aestuarii]|uniref:CHASE2 domain-containing protein n=1 Tax=Oxynema aestuarii AP17 TaxID=2064643 RepID=A0A6H1TWY8_9CYAN|nr:CHASE2 domain-containing protein [Oxynema aestuarii]QIZ71081.1 CHASE2 domain-containing protein [Oxynema aestuarii AP17]